MPRLVTTVTQTERDALATLYSGLTIFNSSKRDMQVYRNGSWENVGTPAGTIQPFAGDYTKIPDGWLICDGSLISRTVYADLFQKIGTSHGVGNGTTTFGLPDLRGRFLRAADFGVGRDPDRASRTAAVAGTFTLTGGATTNGSSTITVSSTSNLAPGMTATGTGIPGSSVVLSILSTTTFQLGSAARAAVTATATNTGLTFTFSNSPTADFVGSVQTDQYYQHGHTYGYADGTQTTRNYVWVADFGQFRSGTAGVATDNAGGNETRPLNVAACYIIKY